MFKYNGFGNVLRFMRKTISPKIESMVATVNITESEINVLCNAKENEQTKKEIEALLLSYLYTFMQYKAIDLGM